MFLFNALLKLALPRLLYHAAGYRKRRTKSLYTPARTANSIYIVHKRNNSTNETNKSIENGSNPHKPRHFGLRPEPLRPPLRTNPLRSRLLQHPRLSLPQRHRSRQNGLVANRRKRPRAASFLEDALVEIKSALASSGINAAIINAAKGLPSRQAEYEAWATKAAEALIAAIRAGLLASARAELDAELKKKAEIEELELAELEACYSPVSPIDPLDLAMVDWDGPEPSVGRPSPVLSFSGTSGEVGEENESAVAAYLDLDGLEPLVEVASVESLTPVKARIVDC